MAKKITALPMKQKISLTDLIPIVDMDTVPTTKHITAEAILEGGVLTYTASDIYIDAINGNDNNDGMTVLTAFQTHQEFFRRTRGKIITAPSDVTAFGARHIVIHILSNLPESDPINLNCYLGQDVLLRYLGDGIDSTLVTGTFTGVVSMNPAINQPFEFTDSGLSGNWTTYLGQRVRITSGARQNVMMWIAKDLGSKKFRSSCPALSAEYDPETISEDTAILAPYITDVFQQSPIVGDHYAVEKLFTVAIGNINIICLGAGDTFFINQIQIDHLEITSANGIGFCPELRSGVIGSTTSKFNGLFIVKDAEQVYLQNCYLLGGLVNEGGSFGVNLNGGLVTGIGVIGGGIIIGLTNDIMFQGCGLRGDKVGIQTACIFDAVESVGTSGNGIDVGRLQIHTSQPNFFGGSGMTFSRVQVLADDPNIRLWGSGNSGYGVMVRPGCQFIITRNEPPYTTLPTITGNQGDFCLQSGTSSRAWNETTGAYTIPISNTWTNLNTDIGSGGFSGNAHNVAENAHMLLQVGGE